MIVDYFHSIGTEFGPLEHDSPLVVDANRVQTQPPTAESLEAIAGRYPQIFQAPSLIQLDQLPQRHSLYTL